MQHYRRYGSSDDRALRLWDICVLGYRRYLRRQLQHVRSGEFCSMFYVSRPPRGYPTWLSRAGTVVLRVQATNTTVVPSTFCSASAWH
eukprot:620876-Pyramimonas_sp.AAC.1